MVSYENGKKKRSIKRWIAERPKTFAFLVAVLVLVLVAAFEPEYIEPVSRAFVLLIGVGL